MDIDPRTERSVEEWLEPGPTELPDYVLYDVINELDETPQTRRRFLGRWLHRDEGARRRSVDRDHPPDHNRRNRLMFTTTGVISAVAILALAVNALPTETNQPNAGAGSTLSVAADGSGEYTTINEAVAAAADGDTVMVKPGTYDESITIDKDITLMGDGPREEIVVSSLSGPLIDLDDSNATVAGLTLEGWTTFVNASGGAPTLEDLWFRGVGVRWDGGASTTPSLRIDGGSTAIVRDNLLTEGGSIDVYASASPLIVDNELRDGPHIGLWGAGDSTVVRGNAVIDSPNMALQIQDVGHVLIVDNKFDGAGELAVLIGFAGAASSPILQDNVITRAPIGVEISLGSAPTLEGNQVDVEGAAIHFAGQAAPVFAGNTLCGGEAIVTTRDPLMAVPSLDGNEVCEVAEAG